MKTPRRKTWIAIQLFKWACIVSLFAYGLHGCCSYAASLPDTIVTAPIVPGGDDANDYPIGDTTWMLGTMKQVPDLATRDLISALRRSEGMFCYVTGETNLYALVGGTNNANWMLWASPTNTGITIVQVNNFVETNLFQTIHVLTNFFDTVYVTNKLELEYLTPNTVLQADANRDIQSIVPNILGMLTNSGPGGLFGWSQDALILTNVNNLSQSLSNYIAGIATNGTTATNVVWPIAGTNVILTTNLLTVRIDVPGQTNGLVFDVFTTNSATSVSNIIQSIASNSVPMPVVTAGTDITITTNAAGTQTNYTVGLTADSVTVNGTANEIATTAATITLGGSATLSLPSVLIAPGTFAAVTGITNQSFAASGYVTNDANGKLYTTPTIPNAGLANNSVTVNGTANHVTTTSATIALGGSATLDVGASVVLRDANNVWVNTSSNFNNNAVWTDATNANNTTPDFAIRTSTLSTNNNFTWLLPTHLDGSGKVEQWIKTSVTNSSGSLITMTAPAGCHVCGAGANNVTNWTEILWQYYPPSGPTNYWPIPGY